MTAHPASTEALALQLAEQKKLRRVEFANQERTIRELIDLVQAKDARISALEGDLERAKGLMQEAGDKIEPTLIGEMRTKTECGIEGIGWYCECGGMTESAWEDEVAPGHKPDCIVSRLRAAAGQPVKS